MSEHAADVTLEIPRPLYEQLGQAIDGTGFRSVTEFTVYVLRDLVASQRAEAAGAPAEQLSREELDAVRRRLQAPASSSRKLSQRGRAHVARGQAQARSERAGDVSSERTSPWRRA
jgi:hypothetical protein